MIQELWVTDVFFECLRGPPMSYQDLRSVVAVTCWVDVFSTLENPQIRLRFRLLKPVMPIIRPEQHRYEYLVGSLIMLLV